MKTDSTGIAARMMLSLDRERICECLLSHRQLQSTPLQVRYPQGVRDALGIMSEQLSLSVSDLTRILVEDALSEMFLPADNIVRRLLSRMEHIMQAHDISATTMAALLAPWNIRPAVFREPDRLTDYLTGEILAALADWFLSQSGMAERQGALSTVSSGRLASHTGDILQDYFSPREYGHYSLAWFSVCRNAFRRILRRSAQAEKRN
ncbi:protein TraE [Escherichia coli]|nr:protein TraE [Escherichia coli]